MAAGMSFEQIQKSYFKVFIALMVLTALTVGVPTIHFGDTANICMHLKFDNRRLRYFVTVPLFFFVTLVFTLTMLGL